MAELVVVGSVALDSVKTPFGQVAEALGGSATYFSYAASFFTRVHVVAAVGEIAEGGRKFVNVEGREIGVFNVKGEFFALLNRCPHAGASLCRGTVIGLAESDEPGE